MNDEDIYPLLSFGGGGNSAQHNGTKTALKQAFFGFYDGAGLRFGWVGLGTKCDDDSFVTYVPYLLPLIDSP